MEIVDTLQKTASPEKVKAEPHSDIIPCSIKLLPQEQWVEAANNAIKLNPANAPAIAQLRLAFPNAIIEPDHIALLTAKYWGNGGVRLSVGFMDNPPADLRARIISHMNAWAAFANVQFFETTVNPQVRINRGGGTTGGYWSYLGTDILSIPANQPTMNLENFSMSTPESEFHRVVRHETGHTLGFPHEHMRAEIVNGIDREKAIAYFMRTQGWSRDKVIAQVLTPLDSSALLATAHADPNSIMCYWLPAEIMKNGVAVAGGTDIDGQDGQFAGQVYPPNMHARTRTPISVVARFPQHLDVFAVASNGRTMSVWWDANGGWARWFQVSGGIASPGGGGSPVTSIARVPGHLDLFTVGTDNKVYSCWWDQSSTWSTWFPVGNLVCRPGSTVNVVSRNPNHLDLFTTASDGKIMSTWWDANGGWANWFQISGGLAANGSTVTAIARVPGHLDVFAIGVDNKVYSCWWDQSSTWSAWFLVGNQLCHPDSTVNVVARNPNHLDLFTTASDGKVMSTWWDNNGGWGSWFQVSGGVASNGSPVTVLTRNPNHLDLFVIGTDNKIYSCWWDANGGWAAWFVVSGGIGEPGGQIAAISRTPLHIDLFTVGADGIVYSTWWDANGGWAGWFQVV